MTKEQMQKEIARLNHKIEIELTEIKALANWLLAKADDADSITFHPEPDDCSGHTIHACIDIKTGRPCCVPASLHSIVETH